MALGPRLNLRQTASLVMTPQLRQAIKLLQFSNLEVLAFVEEELERNPLLERDEGGDGGPREHAAPDQGPVAESDADSAALARAETFPAENAAPLDTDFSNSYDAGGAADGGPIHGNGGRTDFSEDDRGIDETAEQKRNLQTHLSEQLRLSFDDPRERLIGAYLIALLCPAGRLTAAPEDIAAALNAPLEQVESVRARMVRFDPVGLFARDLKECLAAQLAEKNRLDPAMATLLDNLELLARREMRQLCTICGLDMEDLMDMLAEIRRLDPKPAAGYDSDLPFTVVPDVLMRAAPDGGWLLELNPETMPRVLVNQSFHARVAPRADRAGKIFLAEHLLSANWLVKSLQQRAQTILKVASEIVRRQEDFFRHGISQLHPLILRDVAELIEMHESTVSRVTANKYISTPRGVLELKFFFTTAINSTSGESHSSESVRCRIRGLVESETADNILSDDALVGALRKEGVDIARRTVAKYRDALHILSSVQRKREKMALA
ncbi:MAG: RNA polymerase sigma-54 factor [Acetobacteraceae bacterium]|nr:RNA polymerase sigma-54 factor [Acetobacteraceae bacterium]